MFNSIKYLIINADDFGLNKEVNDGIILAFKKGIVTNTSLLVNREGYQDALIKIKENPKLSIGLHLNIFRGKSLTKLNYIVDKRGNFLESSLKFFMKYYLNKKKFVREASKEFQEQINKLRKDGIKFYHLDTEKHVHILPGLFNLVINLAEKNNIKSIRFPFESKIKIKTRNSQKIKLILANMFSKKSKKLLVGKNLNVPDHFYGVSLSKNYSIVNMIKLIKNLKPGVSELSCHPGKAQKSNYSYIDKHRLEELKVLTNPKLKEVLRENNIKITNFRDVYKHGN